MRFSFMLALRYCNQQIFNHQPLQNLSKEYQQQLANSANDSTLAVLVQ